MSDLKKLQDDYGIVTYALRNKKHRYFLPGKNNIFDGIICERVMFDTGCNTILPFPTQINFEDFFNKYQNGSCHISSSSGTGSLGAPTLIVEGSSTKTFKIELENSIVPFTTKRLRFHVSLEDAVNIEKYCEAIQDPNKDPLKKDDHQKLQNYIQTGTTLESSMPDIKFGVRRRHALLGQDMFQNYVVVQNSCVTALIDQQLAKPAAFNEWDKVDKLFVDELKNLVKDDPEFNDLEDEDHDEETDCEETDPRFTSFKYHDS